MTDPTLRLKLGEADFTQGRSTFRDHLEELREPTAKVYVPILVGAFKPIVLAQLDTGAAWSVLDPVVARSLGLLYAGGLLTRLESRFGSQEGRLIRVPIRFIADHGTALDTEATFFISPTGLRAALSSATPACSTPCVSPSIPRRIISISALDSGPAHEQRNELRPRSAWRTRGSG